MESPLKDELMWLQRYLKDADSKQSQGIAGVAVLVSQIREVSNEAEEGKRATACLFA